MPQANDLSRCLVTLEQDTTLIAVIELSQASWLVAGIVPAIERQPVKKIEADEAALLRLLGRWRDEATRAGRGIRRVCVAFEAGRDGFWLARWLRARGIEAHVIHPSSVAVPREHRRAKTDRLDTELLKRAFLGWLRGERDHCRMAAVPTLEEEDAKRPNREHASLVGERTRIVNRIKGTLARLGVRGFKSTLRKASERLGTLRTPEGMPLPSNTLAELGRDMARLRFVMGQIEEVEAARLEQLRGEGACHDPPPGPDRGCRDRDRRHAGARGPFAQPAGPQGRGALRRPHRIAGRERAPPAGEGLGQGGQCPRAPWHGAARLALPALPERKRARWRGGTGSGPPMPAAARARP